MNIWQVVGFLALGPVAAALASEPEPDIDCDRLDRAPDIRCSPVVTVALALDGERGLWRLWVDQDQIWIQRAETPGAPFDAVRAVNTHPEPISTGAENRPQILIDGPRLTVVWSRPGEARFTADVRVARSTNGGRSFGAPVMVNRDGLAIGHSFAKVVAGADGDPLLLWLDGRDRHAAAAAGDAFTGSSLYSTRLEGSGRLAAERAAAYGTCECCRLAVTRLTDGRPLVMWRHIFDGERDHALGIFDGDEFVFRRSTFEQWRIDGCPHHGPALVADDTDAIHAAWFSGAPDARGVFYRRFELDWLTATEFGKPEGAKPLSMGDPDRLPSHPTLATAGSEVVLAWREFDGEQHLIQVRRSGDRGRTWGQSRTVARHVGAVDHPALVRRAGEFWLSWHLPGHGHRLILVEGPA
ncbi:MAG: sialidase family protein [Wenzhouxiangellaceae bacterium]